MNLVLPILIGILAGAVIVFFVLRQKKQDNGGQTDRHFELLNQRLSDMASYFSESKKSSDQALQNTIKMVNDQLKDSRESVERSSQNVHKQVQEFTSGLTQILEAQKQVHESVKTVASFQNIFKAPKLRGIWGEASLEAALSQYFPRDSYKMQYYFKNGEAVDAILRLPNDIILPIDSKFPMENFEKMIESDNDINRDGFRKVFLSDAKKKIDEASKYVRPSEGTTDFVLMYIPAETVYYEIVNNIKEADVPAYAQSKRVILVSPNTFMLSISSIRHWLKDVQMSKQTKEIMKRLDRVLVDGRKLGEDFKKLGKHLSDARSAYDNSEKRLSLMTDRTQTLLEAGEKTGETESKEVVSEA
ncbi:MAG: hypothetical protein COV29_01920 [Candidatus Yanofskybacteria bacterium CG10_big_fil_rev_8_21_14_0_10_36_16]|uniref:DNA recombination protein RmuC n=1 Tax=Candidatus Yanofskybacteria bacterium CG10_big_fil_rev_8_21_14_0_10_36_16 TaxID=1975096 RepID=A0A2J0Q7F3_9BACT|nr:MAG: hypothetical protein COV29_01920 [Candidatus Yanofskybacteria bacterium CG10_big_fil_rev_8_21_14_0_10_36_16]